MKKRPIVSTVLAVLLSLAVSTGSMAEDLPITENDVFCMEETNFLPEEENDVSCIEDTDFLLETEMTENVPDSAEGISAAETIMESDADSGAETDEETDTFLLSVEEVELTEQEPYLAAEAEAAEEEIRTETVYEKLSPAASADCACSPKVRTYNGGSFNGNFGNQLSAEAKQIYDAMKSAYVTQLSSGTVMVTFDTPLQFRTLGTENGSGGLTWNRAENGEYDRTVVYAVQSAYDAFIYDYPEVFWIGDFYYYTSITFKKSGGSWIGSVSKIRLEPKDAYNGASAEIGNFQAALTNAANEIGGRLPSGASREQTVKEIHEYLCETLTYAEGTYAHSAAGAFLKGGSVVCEGYAKAFKLLCGRFGIDCILVVGNAGSPHMWNYVKMENGNWYLVDVTWDDGNPVREDYFLVGSGTKSPSTGGSISSERSIYTNFSSSQNTQSFSLPLLSGMAYAEEGGTHLHAWKTIGEQQPTCQKEGYRISVCTGCGEYTCEILECAEHSFSGKTYVYNQDATCFQDGTKTEYCDFDCGTKGKTSVAARTKLTPTLKFNASSVTLKTGQTTSALKVSGLAKGDKVVRWTSSNTKIVKVSQSGKLTARKKTGTATVTVTLDSGYKKSIKVKVQSKQVKTTKISGIPKTLKIVKGQTKKLSPVLTPITTQEKVTYVSSDSGVASVSSKGVITARKAGKAKITVKSGSKKVTVTVTIPKTATTKITNVPKTVTLKVSKTKTLKPKKNPTNSDEALTYRSSNTKVASVSSRGKITARKKGTAVITVKSGKISVKCTVTVQ